MSKPKVYIDGREGTTGLQIYDRLAGRDDIELLLIDEGKRKDVEERRKLLNAADLVFLCLPDAAAVEAVSLIDNDRTRVIDCSTAHRTEAGWVYGFPELHGQREKIVSARRVANPGCHATGFISAVFPLMGMLPSAYPLSCFSLTGYSGGGKKMIAQYEGEKGDALYSPRIYGLSQNHKHLPEMQKVCGLTMAPVFCPIVDDYYKGMATTVCLHNDLELLQYGGCANSVWEILSEHYEGQPLVKVAPLNWGEPMIAANTMAGKDTLTLIVCGSEDGERTTVTALFDNLGKGASGAAVQNMNLMLGFEETRGLNLD